MDNSVFMDKKTAPDANALENALSKAYPAWKKISGYVFDQCVNADEEWNFSKFGWNCRLKDGKRIIVYLMPCDGFFKVSMVLGKRAVEAALEGGISDEIKSIIRSAKSYAEGTGFRIYVNSSNHVGDIKKLVAIKLLSK